MAEEEYKINGVDCPAEGDPKLSEKRARRKKRKKIAATGEESNGKSDVEVVKEKVGNGGKLNPMALNGESEKDKQLFWETAIGDEEITAVVEGNPGSNDETAERVKIKKKKKQKQKQRLLKEAAVADKRGVCYLSRIPPHMDHVKLRHVLSQFGEVQRIYLAPEDPAARVYRKKAGGFRGQVFSEGWVEFTNKSVAKRVANMLNGEQIGGRKRSQFYYDLWNIKYLSKFKWDDLTEEIALKNAIRQQKIELENSAAKRERDFYLTKVDQSRALSSIEERIKKKQKVQQESGAHPFLSHQPPKIIRQFPQKKPVADEAEERKPQLSEDILAGVCNCCSFEFFQKAISLSVP
uniref:Uncharacterized protein MANES_15G152700 n=1 Tax=Rhizophora mucronata TaxID=61149 RepID=A0A2P2JN78_RHIMU